MFPVCLLSFDCDVQNRSFSGFSRQTDVLLFFFFTKTHQFLSDKAPHTSCMIQGSWYQCTKLEYKYMFYCLLIGSTSRSLFKVKNNSVKCCKDFITMNRFSPNISTHQSEIFQFKTLFFLNIKNYLSNNLRNS